MTSARNISRFALPLVLAVGLTALAQVPPSQAQSASPQDRRATALKLPEILDALALSQGSQVADVGAGEGFLTARLAKVVGPVGRVYAVDIDDKNAIPKLKELVRKESLQNVGDVTHARLNIFPDGGIARLRLFGRPRPGGRGPGSGR